MAFSKKPIYAFNRGIVSALGLARLDVDHLAFAAEIPVALGSFRW